MLELSTFRSLNEVQFPKELQLAEGRGGGVEEDASMKCSSRRNCNRTRSCPTPLRSRRLNEVQFPKELQPLHLKTESARGRASMKCSSRRNCNMLKAKGVLFLNEVPQ